MAEKSNINKITKEDLEKHISKVNDHLTSIRKGGYDTENLTTLLKDIGGDKDFPPKEVADSIDVLRKGFSLYYEMYAILEDRIAQDFLEKKVDVHEQKERITFLGAYSMFAAASYMQNKFDLMTDEEPVKLEDEVNFNFELKQDDVINWVLSRYHGVMNAKKRHHVVKEGKDIAPSSIDFFKKLRDKAIDIKDTFDNKLVDLVRNAEFDIAGEANIKGYEASFIEEQKKSKIEFTKVTPKEVVGNIQAKRKVIRYMDRLALYDSRTKSNPCMILGGLSWTNLWDGLPGTGKTTMMRMAMTRLAELSEIIGLKYKIHSIDQSVKSEFYGKTGQNALAEFNSTRDPNFLHITILDDLDLLTAGSRQDSSGSADNDLRNTIMQFLDGAFTLKIGNNQVYAASNDPKGLDYAVRNRFNDRLLIGGPVTSEDMADMAYILTRKLRDNGLMQIEIGYTPLETQDNYLNGKWTRPDEEVFAVDPEFAKKFKKATIKDFGNYVHELKEKNESITGRSVKAIIEAIKERSANFDVPPEFFEKRSVYIEQPWKRKLEIVKELFQPIKPEMMFEEAKRYAESEDRFSKGEADRAIEKGYNNAIWGMQAEIKALKEHPGLYEQRAVLINQLRDVNRIKKDIKERVGAGN